MSNELTNIQKKIYVIRGRRVMLDFDLAAAYEVKVKALNQAVKRNIERFPEDFMFQLTKDEWAVLKCQIDTSSDDKESLRSQIVTIKNGRGEHKKYMPYAFTEHGALMLASVLRSGIAVEMSIKITRAFVAMRQMISSLPATQADVAQLRNDFEELKRDIEDILSDQNDINESTRMQLDSISIALAELQSNEPHKPRHRIGFVQD